MEDVLDVYQLPYDPDVPVVCMDETSKQLVAELSVLSRQCLDRRIATKQDLVSEVLAWEEERNSSTVGVDWQFTTADARVKLKRLYPEPKFAST